MQTSKSRILKKSPRLSNSLQTAKKKSNTRVSFVDLNFERRPTKHVRAIILNEGRKNTQENDHFIPLCSVGAYYRFKFSVNAQNGKVSYIAKQYNGYATDYLIAGDPYKLNCVGVFTRALTHPNIGLDRFTGNLARILGLQFVGTKPAIGGFNLTREFTHEDQNPQLGVSKQVFLVDASKGSAYVDGHGHVNYTFDDVLSWFKKYKRKHVVFLSAHKRRSKR